MIDSLIKRYINVFGENPTKQEIKKSLETEFNIKNLEIKDLQDSNATTSLEIAGKDKKKIIEELKNFESLTDEEFNNLVKKAEEEVKEEKKNKIELEKIKKNIKKNKKSSYFIFEKEGQAKKFIEDQPLFYDRGDLFWLWNFDLKKWEIRDKTDILNGIKQLGINTINGKERTEIINALQQVGRENMPEEIPLECVQFQDRIINIKTGEEFDSTPKYFTTNPIPWKVGESEDTPTIDKLFIEWVGEKYAKTLYQILAYATCSHQFMQRMIALVGGGSNGKGTFIKLLRKFVGDENCVSSELSLLSSNQFETSSLYKKLVCEIGEVSDNDLKSTNQIKKLSGEDKMRYCFKGKTPFTDNSPTTCLINTNSLPTSRDKTVGFYRRWLIVDFPNQFPIKEGILDSIPEKEYENLAKKTIRILKEMYKTQKFENEGDYQERMERYEERSNPIMRFIELYCEEDYEGYIPLKKFGNILNEYLKNKHLRVMSPKEIKKKLNEEGFTVQKSTKNYKQDVYIFNLKLKNIPFIPIIPKFQTQPLREKRISKNGINGIKRIKSSNSLKIIDFFKENPDRIINLKEIESFFPNPKEELDQLKQKGMIFEPQKNKYQYLG